MGARRASKVVLVGQLELVERIGAAGAPGCYLEDLQVASSGLRPFDDGRAGLFWMRQLLRRQT